MPKVASYNGLSCIVSLLRGSQNHDPLALKMLEIICTSNGMMLIIAAVFLSLLLSSYLTVIQYGRPFFFFSEVAGMLQNPMVQQMMTNLAAQMIDVTDACGR